MAVRKVNRKRQKNLLAQRYTLALYSIFVFFARHNGNFIQPEGKKCNLL